jgi:hypothetical protein
MLTTKRVSSNEGRKISLAVKAGPLLPSVGVRTPVPIARADRRPPSRRAPIARWVGPRRMAADNSRPSMVRFRDQIAALRLCRADRAGDLAERLCAGRRLATAADRAAPALKAGPSRLGK